MNIDNKPLCPECGSGNSLPIIYGSTSPEMLEQVERGLAVMGGCIVDEEAPAWLCQKCGAKYGQVGPQ